MRSLRDLAHPDAGVGGPAGGAPARRVGVRVGGGGAAWGSARAWVGAAAAGGAVRGASARSTWVWVVCHGVITPVKDGAAPPRHGA